MRNKLEIEEFLKKRYITKAEFYELNNKDKNYYIGWSEGLEFVKNAIDENEFYCEYYIREMMKCLLKKNTSENIYTVDDYSFGWFDGYYDSLKWALEE